MSRGLNDPGINHSFSDYMDQLNERAEKERGYYQTESKAVAESMRDAIVKESEREMQEKIEKLKRDEAEKLRKEHGINSAEIDNAWKDLANSFKHSPGKNIVATIV